MHDPEVARARRRSWQEIEAYYQGAVEHQRFTGWRGLLDFSRAAAQRAHLASLVTVGSLGSVFVFRGPECTSEGGYIVVAAQPIREPAEIKIGFFPNDHFEAAKLMLFDDSASALEYFERCLVEHHFATGTNS